ncbi:MAG: toll/interleukin-1 receptor domain-containing protein [Pseudomonadota bacterium]
MAQVFLSYSSKDFFFAHLLRIKLGEFDHSVWIDSGQLRAGEQWRQSIDLGITNSAAMLVALSEASVASSYVTYEWASAMGKEKPVIPILLERCTLHPKLEPIQYIDFSNRDYLPWDKLAERLDQVVTESELPEEPEPVAEAVPGATAASASAGETEADTDAGQRFDRATNEILAYLNARGFSMVSNARIRDKISADYSDAFLQELRDRKRHVFRLAVLKGGKIGLKKI